MQCSLCGRLPVPADLGVYWAHCRGMEGCQELLQDSHVRRFLQVAGLRAGTEPPQRDSRNGRQVRHADPHLGKGWRGTRSSIRRDLAQQNSSYVTGNADVLHAVQGHVG